MDPFIISLILFVLLMGFSTMGIDSIYRKTKLGFFVHNRTAPYWQVAFSAAASWMYVFAIVMTAMFAVTKGPVGSFWFTMPYVLTIMYFGMLGYQLLSKLPKGFTFSEFIKIRYKNKKITFFYQTLHLAAAVYAITANLTGFGIITEYVSKDFSYNLIVAVLGITILTYSIWGGIKSSLITDTTQMILILFVSVVFSSWSIYQSGGIDTVISNWSLAKPSNFFNIDYMLDPGLLLLLLFAGSIMADNGAYQKVLSLGDRSKIIKAYLLAGFILIVCYTGLALSAATIFSLPINLLDPKLAGIQVVEHTIGITGVILFVLATLAKASSSTDTALNSAGSIVANDFFPKKNQLLVSRVTMAIVITIGVFLSALKIDLWILITTFGVFRLLAIIPTLYALFGDKSIKTNTVFWSMICTGIFGLYSIITKIQIEKLYLSIIMIAVPCVAVVYEYVRAKHGK